MTAREKFDANEQRLELFRAVLWKCAVCGESIQAHGVPQLGHRVPKTRSNLETWGKEVIHSPLNMVPVCCLDHNAAVSLGSHGEPGKALLMRIVRINTGRESMPDLASYYRAVGKEVRDKR